MPKILLLIAVLAIFHAPSCITQTQADECVYPGTCRSLNSSSRNAQCKCREGYASDPHDGRRCKPVTNENASLIFGSHGSSGGINQLSLSQRTVTRIQNHSPIYDALDVMYQTNTMFFSDTNGNIYTAPIRRGAAKKVVLSDSKCNILSLAVDWVYGHLYFITSCKEIQRYTVSVANLDGSMKKVLLTTRVSFADAIAVNPLTGWIYGANVPSNKIERAAMDGSQREVIANTEPEEPRGLALDMTQNRLYWTTWDLIYSMNVDGSDKKLVFQATKPTFKISDFYSITIFGDFVYWREAYTHSIYRTNKCEGGEATALYSVDDKAELFHSLQAYHFSKQPKGINYCKNRIGGQCSHLCFRIPSTENQSVATKCACPDGHTLSFDQRTCA